MGLPLLLTCGLPLLLTYGLPWLPPCPCYYC